MYEFNNRVMTRAVRRTFKMQDDEDPNERRMFDQSVRLYGSPLKAMAASLTVMSRATPKEGSLSPTLAIWANECTVADARVERLEAALLNIYQVWQIRSELFTNDEDCAASLADRARAAIEGIVCW